MANNDAHQVIEQFRERTTPGRFPWMTRDLVADQLIERVEAPGRIDQRSSSLCGPTSLIYHIARDRPGDYVRFVIDLFESGSATMNDFHIEPGVDMLHYNPDDGDIAAADWIALASIRDSKNLLFDYQSVRNEFAGITLPGELASWFAQAGYRDVREEANIFFKKNRRDAETASRLFEEGYNVALLINANMLDGETQTNWSLTPDHWVVLTSPLEFTETHVRFTLFTWGDPAYAVPQGAELEVGSFVKNYYGYVACRG